MRNRCRNFSLHCRKRLRCLCVCLQSFHFRLTRRRHTRRNFLLQCRRCTSRRRMDGHRFAIRQNEPHASDPHGENCRRDETIAPPLVFKHFRELLSNTDVRCKREAALHNHEMTPELAASHWPKQLARRSKKKNEKKKFVAPLSGPLGERRTEHLIPTVAIRKPLSAENFW